MCEHCASTDGARRAQNCALYTSLCFVVSVPLFAMWSRLRFAVCRSQMFVNMRCRIYSLYTIVLLLVTFFGIKKNIIVQSCCGHLPLCSTFSKNSTISPLVSFVKSKRTFGWNPSHPAPVFAVYNLDTFSKSHSFNPGSASSNLFNTSFSKGCPQKSVCFHHIANALNILPSLLHSGPKVSHPLLSTRSVFLLSMLQAS